MIDTVATIGLLSRGTAQLGRLEQELFAASCQTNGGNAYTYLEVPKEPNNYF